MVLDGKPAIRSKWKALGGRLWMGDISKNAQGVRVQDVKITGIPFENARLAIRMPNPPKQNPQTRGVDSPSRPDARNPSPDPPPTLGRMSEVRFDQAMVDPAVGQLPKSLAVTQSASPSLGLVSPQGIATRAHHEAGPGLTAVTMTSGGLSCDRTCTKPARVTYVTSSVGVENQVIYGGSSAFFF